jgi:mannonate dehydratase
MMTPASSDSTASPLLKRRDFAKIIAGGILGAGLGGGGARAQPAADPAAPRPRKNTLHHAGGDYHCVYGDHWTSRKNFEFHQRQGVTSFSPSMDAGGDTVYRGSGKGAPAPIEAWNLDQMKRWKDACDHAGMRWEGIRMDSRYIYLKPGPERDRAVDTIIGNIQKAGQVGVKLISHHWTLIPIRRNRNVPGRGGSTYKAFKLEENWKDLPVEGNGVVAYDEYWERITNFLTKVIPVCEQADVRMAAHPYDPPGLPRGYQGVDNWDAAPSTVLESLQKYEAVVDSHYNGFQLCLGTCGEGCPNPREDILPIVRYLAGKGKIHQIHMRNIRGGLHDFAEVYIDEGDMNFIEVVRILRDAGWAGSYLPDHNPAHPDDPGKYEAFAMAFGYINSLIRAANSEVPA